MTFKGILGYTPFSPTSSTAFLTNQTTFNVVQSNPIDGIIITCDTDSGANFSESMWTTTSLTMDDLDTIRGNFKYRNALGWGRVNKNWLAVLTETTQIDWFSSNIRHVINNLKLAGRFVVESGLYGIWFDGESYSQNPWRYSTLPEKNSHTFEEYEAQVYSIAREIMAYWLDQDKNFQFMTIKGYYWYWQYLEANGETQATKEANPYGLLKAFLNGFYDEMGYSKWGENPTFEQVYPLQNIPTTGGRGDPRMIMSTGGMYRCISTALDQDCLDFYMPSLTEGNSLHAPYAYKSYKGDSIYFDNLTDLCPAIWVDYPGYDPTYGIPLFDPLNPASNYFTPTNFTDSLYYMCLRGSWCWIYAQASGFYSTTPTLPSAYLDCMRTARNSLGLP